MKKEIQFDKLDSITKARTDINPTQKLIIVHLKSYQSNNLTCYQTQQEIATALGLSLKTLQRNLNILEEKNIIQTGTFKELKISKKQYKNRKATIYVEGNSIKVETKLDVVEPVAKKVEPQIEKVEPIAAAHIVIKLL